MDDANRSLIDAAVADTDEFISRGHDIITRNLAGAERLAAEYPAIRAFLPAIKGTLQELFDHLVSVPTLPHQDVLIDPSAAVSAAPPAIAAQPALDLGTRAAEVALDAAGT